MGRGSISKRTWTLAAAAFACAAALHIARSITADDAAAQVVLGNLVIVLPVGVVTISAGWAALQYERNDAVQRQWLLITLGLASFEIGSLIKAFYEISLEQPVPHPGLPDLFFLLWYPLVGLALMLAIMSMSKLFDVARPLAVSFVISAVAAAAMWYYVLRPAAAGSDQGVGADTLNMLYPFASLLVLMPLAMTLAYLAEKFSGGRIALPWRVLTFGIAVIIVADVGFMVLASAVAYTTGSVADLFEAVGYTTVGISALVALDVHQPLPAQEVG
jgi:hypothetical protein